ncbi:MAG: enoyl-CoA hydratase/isomerase family protein [Sporichthyaceae bacterium]|nr:enoyl-CoA hydratase/isomerase family protein [Sporichthyaceae bacterium]
MIERYDRRGVAFVRLVHGPVNALDLELVEAITETFRELDSTDYRAIVFTGAGRAFSAGVDLWRIVDGGPDYVERYLAALIDSFEAVFFTGKPVVAALNGHAIAGGCILASGCDYRIMAAGRIGVPELLVGVPFPMSALEILVHAVGPMRARGLALTGGTHEPADAHQLGLIDEVADAAQLEDQALAIAVRLADTAPADTFRQTKQQLRLGVAERLARHRAEQDPQTLRLWQAKASDGTIRSYMVRTVTRR